MGTITNIVRAIVPYTILREADAMIVNSRSCDRFEDIEKDQSKEYLRRYEKNIDWDNPTTFSEKMFVNKIYCASPEKSKDTDKYEVRKKVEKEIGGEYLIPLIGLYDRLSDVKLEELPDQFVIKCTHDSHSVRIVDNKNRLTKREWKRIVTDFDHFYLKRKPQRPTYQPHYADIPPRIIIEKYMGENINDYKFLCFQGKPCYCWVDSNRFVCHMRDYYDLEWNHMEFHNKFLPQNPNLCEKPKKLEEMISIAEKLSKGYDQVRVDLYELDGKVYFGELTFTSDSGYEPFVPDEWDKKIGDLWIFDSSKRTDIRKKYNSVRDICKNW